MVDPTSGAEGRWLDAEEGATWRVLVAMLTHLPSLLDAQLQRDSQLTFFEYMVLAVLSEHPQGTTRMSNLAMLAHGSLSRLSHVARRLESKGLLRRAPDPVDGRFTEAALTARGQTLVAAAAPAHAEMVRRLVFDNLSTREHKALRSACLKIIDSFDPAAARHLSADRPLWS